MTVSNHFIKKDLTLLAILALFCVYLFREIIIGNHLLTGSDFVAFYFGMKKFLYDQLHTHLTIPFWNPYIFGGIPFWAHFESTIFYPLGFLFWFISPEKAYGYTMFFHLMLAGFFMYILSRSLGIGRVGSFVSAAVFTCNGFVMAILYLGHMSPVESYIWLPIIIYFIHRAVTSKRSYFNASIAGLLWGIQILAGAPQDAFYTFLASLLFLLFSVRRNSKSRVFGGRQISVAMFLFCFGAALSAIQIIPSFEFIGESVRASLDSYKSVTLASYPPEGIVTTVMPHFFGDYVKKTFWVDNVPWSVPQQNLYVGILPIMVLLFTSYRQSDHKRLIIFAGSLAIITLFLAFGRHTPVYKLAYLLPGFDRFRAPSKIIVLWGFSIGLLAGKGMDNLAHLISAKETSFSRRTWICGGLAISLLLLDVLFHLDKSIVLKFFSPFFLSETIPDKMDSASRIIGSEFHRFTVFSSLITLLILLLKRNIITHKLASVLLCAILLVDLGFVNGAAVRHDDGVYRKIEYLRNHLEETVGKDKSLFRVGDFDSPLSPNLEMLLGYQSVGGFTALFLHRYYEYINHYTNGKLPDDWVWFSYNRSKNRILMDLLNVKYEISYASMKFDLRKTYLPRAFIVPGYEIMEREKVLDFLTSPDFEPTQTILFEKDEFKTGVSRLTSKNEKSKGMATVVSYRPDHILVETRSSGPGLLFLSEAFYPGWNAFVDDKPKPILRGNYLFRVVEIPEGHHRVRFTFDPLSIKVGIGITILTLFAFLNILIYRFREKITFLKRG